MYVCIARAHARAHPHMHARMHTHTQNTCYIVPQYSTVQCHISITVQCSTVYYEVIINQDTTAVPVA